MSKSTNKVIGGVVIGVAVGYLAGLLTAPNTGKDTRKKIKDVANKSIAEVEKQLKSLHKQSQDLINKILKDNPKLDAKLKAVIKKAEDSQNKVKQILSSIHGNDNVDIDLDKAIDEAKASLENLKKFAKK